MFEQIEKTTKQLQGVQAQLTQLLYISAIEALVLIFEQLNQQTDASLEELPSEVKADLVAAIEAAQFKDLSVADKRQVIQFLLVSAMREDGLPANYQTTPDAIGMWVGFIAEKFLTTEQPAHVLDLGVGSGNLLATVQQVLNTADIDVIGHGIDNDDTLLTLASGVGALLGNPWQLTLADAVATAGTGTNDLVISDLPIGYYPKTVPAEFTTKAAAEKTFVHHLLLEQAVNNLRPGGLAIVVVPADLFDSSQADQVLAWLQTPDVYFQALLKLPAKLFINPAAAKNLLILQRAGGDASQAQPVLLGQIPEVTNRSGNQTFIKEYTDWAIKNRINH
ncbi:MAG: class I SAM-dependent methyltransferase [Lactobacillaceae bacterium]|nr:class I SAM-dependent methyltransferase [Lactobacillaceae bacterium]